MRTILFGLAVAMGMAGAATADPLVGTWRTAPDDNGHTGLIEVSVCGTSLCGTLLQAFDAAGTPMPSETVGRRIIWDTNPTTGGDYVGMVWSPDRDEEYESRLVLQGDRLSVSGCRRVLGMRACREGGVWSRVE
jgi:uncharacterized protein (DUF2147 family)